MWSWVSLLALILQAAVALGADCVWDKDKDFPEPQPLILDSNKDLVLPVMNGRIRTVRVAAGETVTLACPGNGNALKNIRQAEVQGRCLSSGRLEVAGNVRDMKTLGCSKEVKSTIRSKGAKCGHNNVGDLYAIGYRFAGLNYVKEIVEVCFDPVLLTTLSTRNVIHGASIDAYDKKKRMPFRTSTAFKNVNIDKLYKKESQSERMIGLLGDKNLAQKTLNASDTSELFLARGHLSPDADFVIKPNRLATYYYINAVPQWQTFNNGNWKKVEDAIRYLAERKRTDLVVHSGGWGVLELPDINNRSVEVYLGKKRNRPVVPAPAVLWKVVHDQSANRATAVVGVNNPHLTAAPAKLCQDQCSSLQWLDLQQNDQTRGYIYCCKVQDLRRAIPHVPDLGNVGLL